MTGETPDELIKRIRENVLELMKKNGDGKTKYLSTPANLDSLIADPIFLEHVRRSKGSLGLAFVINPDQLRSIEFLKCRPRIDSDKKFFYDDSAFKTFMIDSLTEIGDSLPTPTQGPEEPKTHTSQLMEEMDSAKGKYRKKEKKVVRKSNLLTGLIGNIKK